MDEKELIESLHALRDKAVELVGVANSYENTKRKSILRTIRTISTALGHAGKTFRTVSMAYEKSQKA